MKLPHVKDLGYPRRLPVLDAEPESAYNKLLSERRDVMPNLRKRRKKKIAKHKRKKKMRANRHKKKIR